MRSATGPSAGCRALGLVVVLALGGCSRRADDPEPNAPEPDARRVTCQGRSPCIRVRVVRTSRDQPASQGRRLVDELERANRVFAPTIALQFDPAEDLVDELDEQLDHDCTLELPRGRSLDDYPDPEHPPPCSSEPNEQRRAAYSRRYPQQLIVFLGTGSRPQYDRKRRRWRLLRREDSHSGFFLPYVFMANTEKARRAWMLVHEMGHYFHLRHPHGPQPHSLDQVAARICRSDLERPIDLFDGDRGFVDDTPPDPTSWLYRARIAGAPDPCAPEVAWQKRPLAFRVECPDSTPRSIRFVPPPLRQNVMSYWRKDCLDRSPSLTPGQHRVVRDAVGRLNRRPLVGRAAPLPRAPTLTVAAGHLHVFAAAADASLRHHWIASGTADDFDSWRKQSNDFAAGTLAAPAAATTGDDLHVIVSGGEKGTLHKWWDGRRWYPAVQQWEVLGKRITSEPMLIRARGTLHLFGIGRGGTTWQGRFEDGGGTDWTNLDTRGTGGVAAIADEGRVHLVTRGEDGRLRHLVRPESNGPKERLIGAATCVGEPSLARHPSGKIWVLARRSVGDLFAAAWDGHQWTDQSPRVPQLAGDPVAVRSGDTLRIFAITGVGDIVNLDYESGSTPARVTRMKTPARLRDLSAAVDDSGMLHLYAIDAVGALWSMSRRLDATARESRWGWLGHW